MQLRIHDAARVILEIATISMKDNLRVWEFSFLILSLRILR